MSLLSLKLTATRLALAEARLVIAKLLWHFDMELDGDHATWVDDARFYVSIVPMFLLRLILMRIDFVAATTTQDKVDTCTVILEVINSI